MKHTLLILIALLPTACTPTFPPEVGYAASIAQMTSTRNAAIAQSTYAVVTQDASERLFAQGLTLTAVPPQLTSTALAQATQALGLTQVSQRIEAEQARATVAYTETQVALVELESEAQRELAENNRAIADTVHGGELWRSVLDIGAGILLAGLGILIAWLVLQAGLFIRHYRRTREDYLKWRSNFEKERQMFEHGMITTSAGPISAVTIAERHVKAYQERGPDKSSRWRGVLKAYVMRCQELGQSGVDHPFSRPTCAKYALITKPDGEAYWQLGHKRVLDMLFAIGILRNDTGQGGEVVLAVDADSVGHLIDFAHLPELPPDPIPACKMTLASYQP